MNRQTHSIALMFAVCGLLSAPALAGVVEQVKARTDALHQLGAAYKAVMDGTRANDMAKIRAASSQIGDASRAIYDWFPQGSGPQPGIKTAAKPDIWAQPAEFRKAEDAFSRQAESFQRVAASDDIDAIRKQALLLGATCKGCHDSFRVPSD